MDVASVLADLRDRVEAVEMEQVNCSCNGTTGGDGGSGGSSVRGAFALAHMRAHTRTRTRASPTS